MLRPSDIISKRFKNSALGYSTDEVDSFMAELAHEYGRLYTENIELNDKVHLLSESIDYYREQEKKLRQKLAEEKEKANDRRYITQEEAVELSEHVENAKVMVDDAEDRLREAAETIRAMDKKLSDIEKDYIAMKDKLVEFFGTNFDVEL